MFRTNEEQNELMTNDWLQKTVTEIEEINKIWPYVTIKGFVRENNRNKDALSMDEAINYMKSHNYDFVNVSLSNEMGYKELIFKYKR